MAQADRLPRISLASDEPRAIPMSDPPRGPHED